MLQGYDLTLGDFEGLEGCNEVLNVTRPDVVGAIHTAYLDAGADCVETNTFGANLAALAEYDASERIAELAGAGARIARAAADAASTDGRQRYVLGSVGPGTKLPSLGHISYARLRDAYQLQAEAMIAGGIDGFQIETCQDLLQAKAAVNGARRARTALGSDLPIFVNVTVETTGTMLLGSEIGAALTALEPLDIDVIGLNCGTGPTEMSEHLRHLSRNAGVKLVCMPNAGLPELGPNGAVYPMGPDEFVRYVSQFTDEFGLSLVGGCCGTTPEHISRLAAAVAAHVPAERHPAHTVGACPRCTPTCRCARTSPTCPSASARTPTAPGRSATRCSPGTGPTASTSPSSRAATVPTCSTCASTTSAGTARPTWRSSLRASAPASRCRSCSTRPSRRCCEAGLERLGGRCAINSVNYEDGDGPDSRFAKVMPLVREHGAAVVALTIDEEGQARTAEWKVRVADRLIADLTGNWGMQIGDIIVDCLTFPIDHRPGGDPPRRPRDHRGDPAGHHEVPGHPHHPRRLQRLASGSTRLPVRC